MSECPHCGYDGPYVRTRQQFPKRRVRICGACSGLIPKNQPEIEEEVTETDELYACLD